MSEFPLSKFDTKEDIYRTIAFLKHSLGLDACPLDSKEIAQRFCKNLKIDSINFETTDICGILYKGNNSTSMALNKNRSAYQQNFDCAHELIHYFSHDIPYCKCVCSEKNIIKQESSIEYQANEGAAEFLVPYESFIPDIANIYCDSLSSFDIDLIIGDLACKYKVTSSVISIRLQSLKYEIQQYIEGAPIDNLRILSDRHQKRENIVVESIIEKRNKKREEENFEGFSLCLGQADVYAV